MAKKKTVFTCLNCGYNSSKWLGRCPSCGEYNTFTEEETFERKSNDTYRHFDNSFLAPITEIKKDEEERLKTGIAEIDRVFGGGIVKGSLSLIGGEPGAGKSTLALTIADKLANSGIKVLYVSAEESANQIKMRADRINSKSEMLLLAIETEVEKIVGIINKENPGLVIIDSIQTVYKQEVDSVAGSINQVRESCAHFLYAAKSTNIPIMIIGHVTKEGMIAGPKMLEHIVDAVMYFEAEKYYKLKILRAVKNRFGSTNEIGIFEMTEDGIKEVNSPSKLFIEISDKAKSGSSVITLMEGTRPILIELQALTSRRSFGIPQRTVTGVDYNRLLLIIAILERKLNVNLENQDIFINVTGGLKVFETGADLGIAASIYSSFRNVPISPKMIFIGELGLDGEVRTVMFMESRIQEAERLGFLKCVIPEKAGNVNTRMEIIKIKNVSDLKKIITETPD
ncbi:MAG: DNA repair protein RadA [Candidatus Goldbacteria bacterium]|nr:DNA repair protein RadA [Candidatus Goldiibacteriota bacterium]